VDVAAVEDDGLVRVAAAGSVAGLRAVEQELVGGKRSTMAVLNSQLGKLDIDARKDAGRTINAARARIQAAVAERAERGLTGLRL